MGDPAPHEAVYEYISLDVAPASLGAPPSPTKVMDPWSAEDGEREPMCKWCLIYAGFMILLSGIVLLIAQFTIHIF